MMRAKATVDGHGRIVIPAEFRRQLDIKEGDRLLLELDEDGILSVLTLRVGIRRSQAIVAKYVPRGVSLVDELIADRRAEVDAEARGE